MLRLAAAALALVLVVGAAQAEEREVARYSGDGMGATRPFTASCPCEIQWQASEKDFVATLASAEGQAQAMFGHAQAGTYYWPKSGAYYFRPINASKWTIRVIEIGPP
jgi:hypothetical protein